VRHETKAKSTSHKNKKKTVKVTNTSKVTVEHRHRAQSIELELCMHAISIVFMLSLVSYLLAKTLLATYSWSSIIAVHTGLRYLNT
jgi:hypothetical protein